MWNENNVALDISYWEWSEVWTEPVGDDETVPTAEYHFAIGCHVPTPCDVVDVDEQLTRTVAAFPCEMSEFDDHAHVDTVTMHPMRLG